jgi:hypothetical protein
MHGGNQRNLPHGTFIVVIFWWRKIDRCILVLMVGRVSSTAVSAVPGLLQDQRMTSLGDQHKTEKKKRLGLTLTTVESKDKIGF